MNIYGNAREDNTFLYVALRYGFAVIASAKRDKHKKDRKNKTNKVLSTYNKWKSRPQWNVNSHRICLENVSTCLQSCNSF
jgi:hypothetical protein